MNLTQSDIDNILEAIQEMIDKTEKEEYTDTGELWELVYEIRDKLRDR